MLLDQTNVDFGDWFEKIGNGEATLGVWAQSIDVVATEVELKQEVKLVLRCAHENGPNITIARGKEAHLAWELGDAGVNVVAWWTVSRPSAHAEIPSGTQATCRCELERAMQEGRW